MAVLKSLKKSHVFCNCEKEIRITEPESAHKVFSSLLLSLKLNQSLFFPIHLKDLAVYNSSMLLYKAHNIIFSDVLWECGQMDHLCRGAAIPVVFSSITIETIEI